MEYSKKIEQSLGELCNHCFTGTGPMCDEAGCLVGFAQKCVEHYNSGAGTRIENGNSKLPVSDYKMYDKEDAAKVIAIACKWCHNCEESHSEDCIVALCRRSMEYATTGHELVFKGSSLIYLRELEEKDPELSSLIMSEFIQLK